MVLYIKEKLLIYTSWSVNLIENRFLRIGSLIKQPEELGQILRNTIIFTNIQHWSYVTPSHL